jgi:hypothetical protein
VTSAAAELPDFNTPEYWAHIRRGRNAEKEELFAPPPPSRTTRDPWPDGVPMPVMLVRFGTLANAHGWQVRYGYAIARVRSRRKVGDGLQPYEYDRHTVVCGVRRALCTMHVSWWSDGGNKPWRVNEGYVGQLSATTLPVFLSNTVIKEFLISTEQEIRNRILVESARRRAKLAGQRASAQARTPKKKERAVN